MALDRSVNAPYTEADAITKTVYYMGTDEVKVGEPFVYTVAAGTATDPSGLRHNQVDRPKASGGIFAGVATRNYPASDPGLGRLIEIACPGSKGVKIRTAAAVTTGDVLVFAYKASTGSKLFKAPGDTIALTALSIGCAVARQTTSAAGLAQADLAVAPYNAGASES